MSVHGVHGTSWTADKCPSLCRHSTGKLASISCPTGIRMWKLVSSTRSANLDVSKQSKIDSRSLWKEVLAKRSRHGQDISPKTSVDVEWQFSRTATRLDEHHVTVGGSELFCVLGMKLAPPAPRN